MTANSRSGIAGGALAPVTLIPYINRIQFGYGARLKLEEELAILGLKRPLVVSDEGVAQAGVLELALEGCPGSGSWPLLTAVPSNPTEQAVLHGLDLLRRHDCNVIVAIGGGSPIDCAKGIALLRSLGGSISDYVATTVVSDAITGPLMPVIALPTTTGSGSEASWGAGLVLSSGGKKVLRSPHLLPAVALCDPELTLGLPPGLTAATGVDALSHSIEAFLSPIINPPADAIALDAARRLCTSLPTAFAHGDDRDARWEVMMGALESAMTTRKGLGAAHALAMPLDGTGLHHGTVIAAVLPAALSFVLETADRGRVARLADALECGSEEIVEGVAAIVERVGLNQGLSGFGISEHDLGRMAEEASASPFNNTSARHGTADDYARIARRAWPPPTSRGQERLE